MLARHAEDLYWIGRYVERAEDTARLLDVTYHTALEATGLLTEHELWSELLAVLYLDGDGVDLDPVGIGRYLVADPGNPGSIIATVGRARENARGVREWLTIELWETINDFHLELSGMDLAGALAAQPYDLCRLVRMRCETIVGVATAAMPRTEGFRFLTLGQQLERARITARLLSVWFRRLAGLGGSASFVEWSKVLKSVSAYEAYLREHRATMEANRVLQFLLQSQELPRSVLYCLTVAERQLARIAIEPFGQASVRAAGRVRSQVEFADPANVGDRRLQRFLDDIESRIQELMARVEEDFFRQADFDLHVYEAF